MITMLTRFIFFISLVFIPLQSLYANDLSRFTEGYFEFTIIHDNCVCIKSSLGVKKSLNPKDSLMLIPGNIKHNDITYKVVAICDEAFMGDNSITKVIIEEGVEEIGNYAFSGCFNLKDIFIPSSVISIGHNIFNCCERLCKIEVDNNNPKYDSRNHCNGIIATKTNELVLGCYTTIIPGTVTTIRENAFRNCLNLTKLIVPEGIELICEYAFANCNNLETIKISSTVEVIDINAFSGCGNISCIIVDENNSSFDSRNQCNAIINTDESKLILGCNNTIIPSDIHSIGQCAFKDCKQIEFIIIPEGIEEIEDYAFAYCSCLSGISLPESLKLFTGGTNFCNCSSLESIYIPSEVERIPSDIFKGCISLKKIVVSPLNKKFDSRMECNAIIETKCDKLLAGCCTTTIVDGIKEIGEQAFNHTLLRSIFIPKSVVKIHNSAFIDNSFCTSISVDPDNKIYHSGKKSNAIIDSKKKILVTGCKNTIIPNDIISIGDYAFFGCANLQTLNLPDGIKNIGYCSFANCTGLYSILLPRTLEKIGDYAFANCKELNQISFKGGIGAVDFGKNCFQGTDCVLF